MSRVEVIGAGWRLKWAGWRWMELGGGGWSLVEVGARFSNTHYQFNYSWQNLHIYLPTKTIKLQYIKIQKYNYLTYLIFGIFAKLAWTVSWLRKLNFYFKFFYTVTFSVLFRNSTLNFWSNKGTSFNIKSNSAAISRIQLGFIPLVIWIFN